MGGQFDICVSGLNMGGQLDVCVTGLNMDGQLDISVSGFNYGRTGLISPYRVLTMGPFCPYLIPSRHNKVSWELLIIIFNHLA